MKLTAQQIDEIWVEHGLDECDAHGFARAIEAEVLRLNGIDGKAGGEPVGYVSAYAVEKMPLMTDRGMVQTCVTKMPSEDYNTSLPIYTRHQQAEVVSVPDGFQCVVVEADFEANTVTVEMENKDWKIHAGEYLLSPLPNKG